MAKAKRKFARRARSVRERVGEALHVLRLRVTERIRLRRRQLARFIEPK